MSQSPSTSRRLPFHEHVPIYLIGMGHGAIHWTAGVFYLLLPFIAETFGLSYAQAGLAVSVFHVATTTTNFVSGPAVDILGRRGGVQVGALLISVTALALFPFASAFAILLALVVAMAMANNIWHPAAISYLSLRYPERRGYALSVHALGANAGDAAAPLAVGLLLTGMTWSTGAAVSALPVLAVAGAVGWLAWRDRRLSEDGDRGGSGVDLKTYLRQVIAALRNRSVLTLALMAGLRTVAQNGLMTFLPFFLRDVLGAGPALIGISLSAFQGAGIAGAPVGGVASDRKGRKPVVLAGLAVSSVLIFILPFLPSGLPFIAGAVALGFALFAVRPVIHSWMMDMTPRDLGGSATSLLFGVQGGLSTITPVLAGLVADQYGLTATMLMFAVFCLLAALTALAIPNMSAARQPDSSVAQPDGAADP